ncbi:hypothetical protein JCM14036_15410 [Desulfotomaculum defluvii]
MIQQWTDTYTGVSVKRTDFVNEVTIYYNGLLSQAGATQIYLHCGFGDPNQWDRVSTEKMNPSPIGGWQSTIRMKESNCHFCFRDSADNWDNNSGLNWNVRYE